MAVSGTDANLTYNPIKHVCNIASTGTEGVLYTANEMVQGGLNFIGQTSSELFGVAGQAADNVNTQYNVQPSNTSIYYSGNTEGTSASGYSDSLGNGVDGSIGQNNLANGFNSLGNFVQGALRGIGGLSTTLGKAAMDFGCVLSLASQVQAPTNALRMGFIAPYSYCYNYYSPYSPYNFMMRYNIYDTYNPYAQYNAYNPYAQYNTYNPYMSYNMSNPYLSMPYGKSYTAADVARILYPETNTNTNNNNNADQKPKEDEKPENKPLPLEEEPNWYRNIVSKAENKQTLTKHEKDLRLAHEKLMRQYSPWNKDNDGNPIMGQLSALGDKILQLQRILAGKNRANMETMLKSMSLEELAAVEAHYPTITQGRSLRADIKDCCLTYGFGWTGYNTDRCNRMMDILDRAAMVHPRAMANALNQAINNHRMFGFGIDDDRVAKLMQMMAGNKEFLAAVEYEYSYNFQRELRNDIDSKWFISSKNKDAINGTLGSF